MSAAKPPEPAATAVNRGSHILIRTNVHPPRVGKVFPPDQLVSLRDISLVQSQRTMWRKILSEALANVDYCTLREALALIVFRSPGKVFDPTNFHTVLLFNTLKHLELIFDDSSRHLLYVAAGKYDKTGGMDIYLGPFDFAQEATSIAISSCRCTKLLFEDESRP